MSKLALLGGEPVRKKPFARWPMWDQEERKALLEVLESDIWGIGGTFVGKFQKRFARAHETRYGIAVMNGTVSLEIALKAGKVGEGDEVIIPPYTFVATATAVLNVNAIPVFVDIEPKTYCLDPGKVSEAITSRTRAIIPVHMAGHPADMDALMEIARKHNLLVIEDAAHAHFAEWRGKKVGSLGHLSSFSFQSSKNMNSGEGGIILTSDEKLADRCWSYHNCGRVKGGAWYHHPFLGGNYRMTEFQAALLLAQMPRAEKLSRVRDENGRYLCKKLADNPVFKPLGIDERTTRHGFHLLVFKYLKQNLKDIPRPVILSALEAEGIPVSRGYTPLYKENFLEEAKQFYLRNEEFLKRNYKEICCPVTEKACEESIWLPQNVLLGSPADLDDVVRAMEKIIDHHEELTRVKHQVSTEEEGIVFSIRNHH
ncbi:MAG: DegT/DnrJ/EryC1/StrS family aminotransferase [Calditrichaeota bacterium]|nr:MAG: DegT/DnrJ/EryC1/StrS family aminotransferase [Calditrichota bacterium]